MVHSILRSGCQITILALVISIATEVCLAHSAASHSHTKTDVTDHDDDECCSVTEGIKLQRFGHKLLYFPDKYMRVGWEDARLFCEAIGMKLISLNSKEEYYVVSLAIVKNGMVNIPIWSSGTDHASEGNWKWDSTGENMNYVAWYKGYGHRGTSANCLGFGAFTGKEPSAPDNIVTVWDIPCARHDTFICEAPHHDENEEEDHHDNMSQLIMHH